MRSDIPHALADCYGFLDEELDDESIAYIKALPESDVVGALHFSLGLWIRNNWLYHDAPKLAAELAETGATHTDNQSSLILLGYHRYLNGKDASLEAVARTQAAQ